MGTLINKLQVNPHNQGLWATFNFAFFANGLMAIILGVLLPYIRSEQLFNYTQTGLIFSAHQAGTFFAVLAAGVLPYIIGRKQSILIMAIAAVVGMVLMIFVNSLFLFIFAFALTGITRGVFNNACNVIVADISGNRTASMNVLHSAWAFGALISPIIVFLWVLGLGSFYGWRLAALTVALFIALSVFFISRATLPPLPDKKEKGKELSFFRTLSFWIPTMLLFLYVAAETSIIGWYVIYFIDAGTLPRGLTELVSTFHWVMMTIGRITVAIIAIRIRNKNRALLFMALAATISFGGMLLSSSPIPSVLFLLGIGLSMAGIYPTTIATMKGATSDLSLGFTVAISGLGAIILPSLIGAVADIHGIAIGISLILATLFIMMLLTVFWLFTDKK
jgi:fucose permease